MPPGPTVRRPAASLRNSSGSLRVVDEAVEILRLGLLDAGGAAALVGDAGAPDLRRLDGREQLVRRGKLEGLFVERLHGELVDGERRHPVGATKAHDAAASTHAGTIVLR